MNQVKSVSRAFAVCPGLLFQSEGGVPAPNHETGRSLCAGARGGQRRLKIGEEPGEPLVCGVGSSLPCEASV